MPSPNHLSPKLLSLFPALAPNNHRVTSPHDVSYNCVAWAVGQTGYRIDPMAQFANWPRHLPRDAAIATFERYFTEIHGYQHCHSGELEKGIVKIALYAKHGQFTHVARQMPDGAWTSKLGELEDITHEDTFCLQHGVYGDVVLYLKKKRT